MKYRFPVRSWDRALKCFHVRVDIRKRPVRSKHQLGWVFNITEHPGDRPDYVSIDLGPRHSIKVTNQKSRAIKIYIWVFVSDFGGRLNPGVTAVRDTKSYFWMV